MQLIAKGAEASLFRDGGNLIKRRLKKDYRISELDKQIRKSRTKRETKILKKAYQIIPVPKVLETDLKNFEIKMEFIQGKLIKEIFEEAPQEEIINLSEKIGSSASKLHQEGIIHNDLTTSNMLLAYGKIYFIDFGLSFHSTRIEDKAMDLVVLKKAVKSSHPKKFPLIWKGILKGYQPKKEITSQIEKIERRVRYSR